MDNTNQFDTVGPQTPNVGTDSRTTTIAAQAIPFSRFLAIAVSATLIFMLGSAFGAVMLFVSVLAKQSLLSQPAATRPQTAEVIVVVQTATPAASQAVVTQPDQVAELEQLPMADAKTVVEGARDYSRLGDKTAPIEIVVFSDPQCPYCKRMRWVPSSK
ncbi:MAG: thioredoxin domain-containing protein [Anaerolineae bacterium]|nr:thioredoxin domain-containing protein [Anaerolineae bacterium]